MQLVLDWVLGLLYALRKSGGSNIELDLEALSAGGFSFMLVT
jgi:hypothetical protein